MQELVIKHEVSTANIDNNISTCTYVGTSEFSSCSNHNSVNSCPVCSNSSCHCQEVAIKEEFSATNADVSGANIASDISTCTSRGTIELPSRNIHDPINNCSVCSNSSCHCQEVAIKDEFSATNADVSANIDSDISMCTSHGTIGTFGTIELSSHKNHDPMNSCPVYCNSSCQCQDSAIKDEFSATNADVSGANIASDISTCISRGAIGPFGTIELSSHNNHDPMNSCQVYCNNSYQCQESAIKEEVPATNIDSNINTCSSHGTTERSRHDNHESINSDGVRRLSGHRVPRRRTSRRKARHRCDVCRKTFVNLNTHMHVHPGEHPYQCYVCSKKFAYLHLLKRHLHVHTSERPHQCVVCNKKFVYSSHLKNHMRVHIGVQRYHCAVCGQRFRWVHSLKSHICKHTG